MRNIFVTFIIICMAFFSGCNIIDGKSKEVYKENDAAKKNAVNEQKPANSDNQIIQDNENGDKNKANSSTQPLENNNSDDMRYTTFYYQDADGLLIPVTRKTARIQGIGKAAIYSLVDVPVIREDIGRVGLFPVLPGGTRIMGMTINNGIAAVDFNDRILDYDTEQKEKNILNCLVYTLTEFDTIESVQILKNGEKLKTLKFGSAVDLPLTRQRINSFMDNKNNVDSNKEHVEVYFTKLVNNKYMYYIPVSRPINKPTSDIDRYMKTLNELIKGEIEGKGLKSYVPKKLGIKGIQIDGQTVILNFDDEILNATHSTASFDTMLKQITLCFKQFGKVKKVKINVNGKALEFLGENKGKDVLEVPLYANQF
ncbi:MAG: Lipoprotein LpqB, GerMN domain protein [Clostridia bacterium]|uniref:GerMN domain-containing protein n=1 Tax=Petroclostridium xylanilyticum TaxID=1792311 RepID=UPI0018E31849|nr:GerMN domain-containing protein [Petroclostridium xylanilyticum]MBZ4646329.1 Lipoprotein LpqB, GerMN domain protein [Clostridia bacterium]